MTKSDYINLMHPDFELITEFNSNPTSSESDEYNCIAWAYGRDDVWCWPDVEEQYFWPVSRRKVSVDAFEELFSSIGYSRCKDASKEEGFLKIALYVDDEGRPTHAARQLMTGKWTSKLGRGIDIEHDSPEILNGSTYGIAKIFMKRKT